MRSRFVVPPLIVGVLVAVAVSVPSSAAPDPRTAQANCTVRNAIYAIVDDSGSMEATDPSKLRAQALKQLKATPGNEQKSLGALEFGTGAQPLFGLLPIGTNSAGMDNILDARIQADNVGTNYNDAFTLAQAQAANANRVIFLTDGGHNEGTYAENHKFGKTVDVIGLGASLLSSPSDDARLAKIASETGGLYKKAQDASGLQIAMNEINAAINCQRVPVTYVDTFNRVGQAKTHALNTGTGDGSVQLSANWATPGDAVDLSTFRLVQTVTVPASPGASARRRRKRVVRRLRAVKRPGASFLSVRVKLPQRRSRRRGRLRFRVKATRIANPALGLRVTTQASRSRRR